MEWEGNLARVKFQNEWYNFEKINNIDINEIISYSKKTYVTKWKKACSEDLIEVLIEMGNHVENNVDLILSKNGNTSEHKGTLTYQNREKLKDYLDELEEALERPIAGFLSRQDAVSDISEVANFLRDYSSYQGLNGFDAIGELEDLKRKITDSIHIENFGIELTKIIAQIGDRHSYVTNYELPNTKFLPFIVAPLDGKVVALKFDSVGQQYELLHQNYPYLTAIHGIDINKFMRDSSPRAARAPKDAFITRAVMSIKYLERNFAIMNKPLPEVMDFTFSNLQNEITKSEPLETSISKYIHWDEKFARLTGQEKEALNDAELCKKLFDIDDNNIGYGRIPDMVRPKEAPIYFKAFNDFMYNAKDCKSIIFDIRSNDGGSRDMVLELAKYLIHPDSIYIANVVKQRGQNPLSKVRKKELSGRSLFSPNELTQKEQIIIEKFNRTFKPIYSLDKNKFSEAHYFVFNGKKLEEQKGYHFDKPVYVMINERCFSASSILAATLDKLSNIKLVGVTTDGSSGNSENFYLPNSHLKMNISTMVSFQKNGKILDGFGTEPDISIERDLDQVLWKEDSQLTKLKKLINSNTDATF